MSTWLITGANRGLGLGLLKALIARPNTTVIAGVRDPSSSSKTLTSFSTASGSKVIVVKIDANDDKSPSAAVTSLTSQGITTIDVVIANAGISNYYGPAAETPISEMNSHYQVNVIGTLALFQAVFPLLKKSSKPIFMAVSTGVASIGDMFPLPATAYGSSKAALNYVTRKIHFENEWLIAFPISPGWVQTDMGNMGATAVGMKEAPNTIEESINGMLGKIDNATREETSGNFLSFDDAKFAW